ncbi:MAG TPA: AAA family ATPase [Microlunatus sp.]
MDFRRISDLRPVLVVIGGLPATGKSTIAAALAARTATPYVRVDRIEQAIVAWSVLAHPVGPVGYAVAHQLAIEQLELGLDVIVECVNPAAVTRDAWPETAANTGAALVEIEVCCSDEAEHRSRVENRASDVDGLVKPTWAEVTAREYEPWIRTPVVVDSATTSVGEAVQRILAVMEAARGTNRLPE